MNTRARPRLRLLPLLAACLIALSAVAHGDDDGDGDDDDHRLETLRGAVDRGEILPLATLKRIVGARFPGDIVRIRTHEEHGALRYEFRVLEEDGNVLEIGLDAASGAILKVENE